MSLEDFRDPETGRLPTFEDLIMVQAKLIVDLEDIKHMLMDLTERIEKLEGNPL